MIKAEKIEKIENKMELKITGDSYDLIHEFNEALKVMCKVLNKSLKESSPFTTEDLLHTMVHDAAAEVKEDE